MPCSCAASSASAICLATAALRRAESVPVRCDPPASALDQLHDESRGAVALLQTVDLRDVRMIERGEDFGFTLEARQPLAIGRHGLGQHLDGDGALQVGIAGAIHLAHAARADLGGDFIGTESGARS